MTLPKITLDQWSALVAVVEAGGYAQASARLHRTQSTVTYTIKKLEDLLGMPAMPGRRIDDPRVLARGEQLEDLVDHHRGVGRRHRVAPRRKREFSASCSWVFSISAS